MWAGGGVSLTDEDDAGTGFRSSADTSLMLTHCGFGSIGWEPAASPPLLSRSRLPLLPPRPLLRPMLPSACIVDDRDACFALPLPPLSLPFLPCPVFSVSKVFSTAIKSSVSSAAVPPSRRTLAANAIISAAPFWAAVWLDAAASAAAMTLTSSLPSAIQRFACMHGMGTKARASALSVVHSPVRATTNCESKKCARDILCFREVAERNSSYRSPKFALPPCSCHHRGKEMNLMIRQIK